MEFRTKIPIPKSDDPIGYSSLVFSVGSCFAVNMAERLSHFKFANVVNPTGILFHPEAICNFFRDVAGERRFSAADTFFHNELYHSFDAHSDLSRMHQDEIVGSLNAAMERSRQQMQRASHIIVTYGTAWIYRHLSSQRVVANCHKVSQKDFSKELLSCDSIRESTSRIIEIIRGINRTTAIIFTISPVRHIKDGFIENQRSKSNLLAGMHDAIQNKEDVHYFPSFEIMMDELRDYRFYADDMIHPSRAAIDYIWQRFTESWISEDSYPIMKEVDSVSKSLAHKPFNPETNSHRQFLEDLNKKIDALQKRFPSFRFDQNT